MSICELYLDKKIHDNLDKLIIKYKSNEYVFKRLINYIENLLPVALENDTIVQKQREDRKNQLSANRDEFTNRFLHKNNYFYSIQTELFLHYDGQHFVIINEDDIQYQILTTISSEKSLREWKHKVNKNIIKRIKERSPLNAIPESVTIQNVINSLSPHIFPSRNNVKYFLTIIGECLSYENKTNEIIYIFPPALKEIIREIGNQCYTYFGLSGIFGNIKFKYYDHNYKDCRLLSIEANYVRKKITIPFLLKKYMIDFLCVSAHYASRYGSSDIFLNHCSDAHLVEHSLFLSKNTPENIVLRFIETSLIPSIASTIDIKNMIFLWKKFLNDLFIPNIIFYEALKTILKTKIIFDEKEECFIGYTGIHLPIVSQYIKFWDETIIDCNDENEEGENELELDEICILFKYWNTINKINYRMVNDAFIIDIIQHFYPDIEIQNNKYILNVKSKLWDKKAEVINTLKKYKKEDEYYKSSYDMSCDSYNIYEFYSLQVKNKYNLLVSKRYFERVAKETNENITLML